MGDQRYSYLPPAVLKDIDILVASHHGGSYSKSSRHTSFPSPNLRSIVIYSYGTDNRYGHPSHVAAYQQRGWTNSHHTTNGDYVLK
ncbi:MAG: hypothetical protein ACLKAM_12440 [Alkaliphilus sp.]